MRRRSLGSGKFGASARAVDMDGRSESKSKLVGSRRINVIVVNALVRSNPTRVTEGKTRLPDKVDWNAGSGNDKNGTGVNMNVDNSTV